MMNIKSIVFICFFILLASFVEAQVTSYGYVERDPNYAMDWSKVGQDISKTLNDAALAKQNQFNQCVELTNKIQEIILRSNVKSNIASIDFLAMNLQSLTFKHLEQYRNYLYTKKSISYLGYQKAMQSIVNNSVFINKQLYNLDLFYSGKRDEFLYQNNNNTTFKSFDSLFSLTMSSISINSIDNEGYKFNIKNMLYKSVDVLSMYDLYGFITSSSNGMYNVYRSAYDRKIQNELMEKLKLEQEIIKLTQYVEFRSNFIANLDKEQKKLFLKNEKKWLKNRFTNTAGINKRYIKNLLYKEPKSWSLTERKTVFILKAFYEYEISNLK